MSITLLVMQMGIMSLMATILTESSSLSGEESASDVHFNDSEEENVAGDDDGFESYTIGVVEAIK